MIRFIFLTLSLLVSGLYQISAQTCLSTTGTVLDAKTNETLPGATIREFNNRNKGTSTDQNGWFELKNTSDSLLVSFVGYQDQVIKKGQNCTLSILLYPKEVELNEVIIKSEKLIAEEFTIRKIKKLDIYTNPSAKADPLLAVNSTPSATPTDESANISLRGSTPAETGIFLNNVPINDAVRYSQLNGIGTFSIFNTALMNNVQVYPGNPPLEFGNTTSGLILLQSDESIPTKSSHTLSATLASTGVYSQNKLSGKSSLTLFSNYQPSTFIKSINAKALAKLKKFTSADLGVHLYQSIRESAVIKIFNYSNVESYQYKFQLPTFSGDFSQKKFRNFTVANFRKRFPNGEVSFNQGYSFSSGSYANSVTNIKIHLEDFYSSLNYLYFGNVIELKSGISYDYKGSSFKGTYPRYDYAVGEQFPMDSSQSEENVKLPEAYIYLKQFIGPKWVIGSGLRKNIPLKGQNNFLSHQTNINYKASKKWNFIFSSGQYNKYQLPQGSAQGYVHIKNRQLSFDVSRTTPNFETTLSLFHKKGVQQKITSEVKGVEWFGKYKFSPHFKSQLSITSLQAKRMNDGVEEPSPYNIHYFIRGNAEYKFFDTWTCTVVFLFRQGSYYVPVTDTQWNADLGVFAPQYGVSKRLPSYNLIDMNLSKIFLWNKHSVVSFVGLSNVFNFKNVRGYSYSFDYTQATADLFSQRAVYFGVIMNL